MNDANSDQANTDGDSQGDACDADDDRRRHPGHEDTNSAADCKKGGYTRFVNPTFKNQGECVSYFAKK